jgi:hypothetical protein
MNRPGGSTVTVPVNWQLYHDPLGLYTLRLPPGWTVQSNTSYENYRQGAESATEPIEFVTFSDASQGTGAASVSIVTGHISNTAFELSRYCGESVEYQHNNAVYEYLRNNAVFPDRQFHGFPTWYMDPATVLFITGTGHFQLDVSIPGVLVPLTSGELMHSTPQPTATPLPASWIAADQVTVGEILASFQSTDPKPLSC